MEKSGKPPALAIQSLPDNLPGAPDWTSFPREIACPLCDYNLRGLITPRCPECGYRFEWSELLNPSGRSHPYLFEHQATRKFRSFWKTAFQSLRPNRFWNSVRPGHKCVPGRLFSYWFIVALVFLLAMAAVVGWTVVDFNVTQWGTPIVSSVPSQLGPSPWPAPPSPPALVPYYSFVWPDWDPSSIILLTSIMLAWPWLSFCALHLVGISMRQAQIRSVHILRAVVYSWDIVLWVALFTLAAGILESTAMILTRSSRLLPFSESTLLLAAWAIPIPVFIYRMLVAYSVYLRFRHAISVVLLTQLVVILFIAAVLTFVVQLPRW